MGGCQVCVPQPGEVLWLVSPCPVQGLRVVLGCEA